MDTDSKERYATADMGSCYRSRRDTRFNFRFNVALHFLGERITMAKTHTPELLETLRQFDAPTVANAIEVFDIQPRNTGFMDASIRCMFPDMGVMVGYACTAIMAANYQPPNPLPVERPDWWRKVAETPGPRVVVMQDSDPQPVGSFWGEVQGNIHKALGCIGLVTNGGVRDMDEVRAMDFQFYASTVLVSHAYAPGRDRCAG